MHPAHVPLEPEAEAPEVRRERDARPGGRLLGHRQHARLPRVDDLVQLAQERDRIEILATAVDVREPLAVAPGVVEVEHRGDRVDPQAVGVVLPQPEQRACEQEVPHLVAAEVEDERPPVRMSAAARVVVLVERGAVEAGERPLVARGSVRGPSRGSPRCPGGAASRRTRGSRRGSRTARSGRRSPSPGSPRSP